MTREKKIQNKKWIALNYKHFKLLTELRWIENMHTDEENCTNE